MGASLAVAAGPEHGGEEVRAGALQYLMAEGGESVGIGETLPCARVDAGGDPLGVEDALELDELGRVKAGIIKVIVPAGVLAEGAEGEARCRRGGLAGEESAEEGDGGGSGAGGWYESGLGMLKEVESRSSKRRCGGRLDADMRSQGLPVDGMGWRREAVAAERRRSAMAWRAEGGG